MNDLFQIRMTKSMGRGIFALKDIGKSQSIYEIQKSLIIKYSVLVQHLFFGTLSQQQQIHKKIQFAFYMTFVKQNKQYQKIHSKIIIRYIQQLPPAIHSLILWSSEQLQVIKDKKLIEKVRQKKQKLQMEFNQLKVYIKDKIRDDEVYIPNYQDDNSSGCESSVEIQPLDHQNINSQHEVNEIHLNSENFVQKCEKQMESDETQSEKIDVKEYKKLCAGITFQKFLFFYSVIQSRSIYYQSNHDSKSQLGALILLLQLFNHSPQGQVEKKNDCFITNIQIHKDQQIFTSYGSYSNQKLLFEYGCLIDEFFEEEKNQYIENQELASSMWKNSKLILTSKQISLQRLSLAQRYNKWYQKQITEAINKN